MKKLVALILLLALPLSGCALGSAPPAETPPAALSPTPAPTPAPTPEPTPEPTPPPPARELTALTAATTASRDVTASLTDASVFTQCALGEGGSLAVSCAEDMGGVYVVWSAPPAEYTLECGEDTLVCGREGFLHEFITLPKTANVLTLTVPAAMSLCTLRVFSHGVPPEDVQLWQPPCEKADILVFPTHGDDDVLFFGALIAQCAGQRGLAVQAAFLTNHWNEQLRPHQLLDGLWTMGVRNYPIISPFPDYRADTLWDAEQIYSRAAVTEWQTEQLRRFRPSVAVGHDINGEYGHGVHRLNASALLDSVELAADETAFPDSQEAYGVWDTPKLYLHLAEEGRITLEVNEPLPAFGGLTAFEVAQRAFLCHAGQEQWYSVRQDGTVHDCRFFGLVRSLVGEDSGTDVMENIG